MSDTARFVWYEALTPDVERTIAFYSDLFDWRIEETHLADRPYHTIWSGETSIGGVFPLSDLVEAPPHWLGYVMVDGVDHAITRATSAGAERLAGPIDVASVGRLAVLADPQGGTIAPITFATIPPPERRGPAPVGHFGWQQYNAQDPAAAVMFYNELFGWSEGRTPMPDGTTYTVFKRGETDAAGLMPMPPGVSVPSHWLYYVVVTDTDETVARATAAGAQVFVPPTNIPGTGRFSVFADPLGAMIGVFANP